MDASGALKPARRLKRVRSLTTGAPQSVHALAHFGSALAINAAAKYDRPGPTWPLGPETRARVSVRWPTRYEWPLARHWVGRLRSALSPLVAVTPAELEQPYEGTVLIEVAIDGEPHEVAIDYGDKARLLDEVAERCPLVFKMQYSADGYGHPHVIPGGYVAGRPGIDRYLPALRRIRDHSAPRFDVYGRFGSRYAQETRRTALELLRSQRLFSFEGSLVTRPYTAFLREAALSSVCIDLPGNGDICHRLVDYLAVGCCVVRPLPETVLHVPLTDGMNIAFANRNLSDFVLLCAELLADDSRRNGIALAARDHYERYLRPDQLAGYYLDRCVALLGGGGDLQTSLYRLAAREP